MNVIAFRFECDDSEVEFPRHGLNDVSDLDGHSIGKYFMAVFHAPSKVYAQARNV